MIFIRELCDGVFVGPLVSDHNCGRNIFMYKIVCPLDAQETDQSGDENGAECCGGE